MLSISSINSDRTNAQAKQNSETISATDSSNPAKNAKEAPNQNPSTVNLESSPLNQTTQTASPRQLPNLHGCTDGQAFCMRHPEVGSIALQTAVLMSEKPPVQSTQENLRKMANALFEMCGRPYSGEKPLLPTSYREGALSKDCLLAVANTVCAMEAATHFSEAELQDAFDVNQQRKKLEVLGETLDQASGCLTPRSGALFNETTKRYHSAPLVSSARLSHSKESTFDIKRSARLVHRMSKDTL